MAKHPANLADPVLLEKIDKFFELGIGEYVALPQVRSDRIPLGDVIWVLTPLSYLLWATSPGMMITLED